MSHPRSFFAGHSISLCGHKYFNVQSFHLCTFFLSFFSIKTLEGNHDDTAKDLIEAKTDFRKTERHWMAEKEFLMRKVQFLQHYGSVVPPSIDGGGYFTENRSNLRRGGDLKTHRDLQKLNVSTYLTSRL